MISRTSVEVLILSTFVNRYRIGTTRYYHALTARNLLGDARRQFFELADIAANARRGERAPAISPIALQAVMHAEDRRRQSLALDGRRRANRNIQNSAP
jgi:transposase